jgi:hypothetical protein
MRFDKLYNEKKKLNDYYYCPNKEEIDFSDFLMIDKKLRKDLKIKRIEKIQGIYSILWKYSVLSTVFTLVFDESYGVFLTAEKEEDEGLLDIVVKKLSKL